jgi:hypothetical protein
MGRNMEHHKSILDPSLMTIAPLVTSVGIKVVPRLRVTSMKRSACSQYLCGHRTRTLRWQKRLQQFCY